LTKNELEEENEVLKMLVLKLRQENINLRKRYTDELGWPEWPTKLGHEEETE
jgi:hypothetical protein